MTNAYDIKTGGVLSTRRKYIRKFSRQIENRQALHAYCTQEQRDEHRARLLARKWRRKWQSPNERYALALSIAINNGTMV